jgi:hypothetical protein
MPLTPFPRELPYSAEPNVSVVRNGIVREQPGAGQQPGGSGRQAVAL